MTAELDRAIIASCASMSDFVALRPAARALESAWNNSRRYVHTLSPALDSAQRDYMTANERAVGSESSATYPHGTVDAERDAAMSAILSREAADTAFGVFARIAAAEGLMAMLDGSMRPL